MVNNSNLPRLDPKQFRKSDSYNTIDYGWFDTRFASLLERLAALENTVDAIEQSVVANELPSAIPMERQYYSVAEFAIHVERSEYTVREWCRMVRINAEKCEAGRGEAKNWKIPVDEIQRYRDHGLLPVTYLR